MSHKNTALGFETLNSCLLDIKNGCRQVCSNKTLIKQSISSLDLMLSSGNLDLRILGNSIHQAVVVKNLGVCFNANFSFADHVCNICKTFIQMRGLRRVRQFLTDEAAILAANALVCSRPDYCNSLFRSLSRLNMCKLWCIQNTFC